ncbi:MAG: hypothetical protein J0H78_14610 [Rhizobiales bacterium]|nr:hypothetical protein [Hyphomicrobiales bacterium]
MVAYGKKLRELPSFLSTASMVFDDREKTIDLLFKAEKPSPPVYEPARRLFCSVLSGDLSWERAIEEAERLDGRERGCAVDVLNHSRDFLLKQPRSRVSKIGLSTTIPNGMKLRIAPIWVRELPQPRLLVLYFWMKPLNDHQVSAVAAILRMALLDRQKEFKSYDLDFVSVSMEEKANTRRFSCLDWKRAHPLDEGDLMRFWARFVAAWDEYQRRPPRVRRRKEESGTLF